MLKTVTLYMICAKKIRFRSIKICVIFFNCYRLLYIFRLIIVFVENNSYNL